MRENMGCYRVGKIFKNNDGFEFKIVEYIEYSNVTVEFIETGYRKNTIWQCVERGTIKDLWSKTVLGVGQRGTKYKCELGSLEHRAYRTWLGMIRRCYGENNTGYKTYGGAGVMVCDEWLNFDNYCDFFLANYKEGYQLDKDLSMQEEYSPRNCVFIPRHFNNMMKSTYQKGNKLPCGVYYDGTCYRCYKGKSYKGSFKTAKEAYQEHLDWKIKRIRAETRKLYKEGLICQKAQRLGLHYFPYCPIGDNL